MTQQRTPTPGSNATAVTSRAAGPAADPTPALAPNAQRLAIINLAKDPSVDVAKLAALIEMQTAVAARQSQVAFSAAMTRAQQAMLPVAKDAVNPQTRSRYASYAALDGAIRPIYTAHGFGLSFNTEACPAHPEWVRVVCTVSHKGGHLQAYGIDMPADGKGAKGGEVMTRTHAVGSAVTYGMRYLLRLIWNIAVSETDDDGNRASRQPSPMPANPRPNDRITPAERKRLSMIVESSGRTPDQMRAWLAVAYGLRSSAEIRRGDYYAICEAVAKPGVLPHPEGG